MSTTDVPGSNPANGDELKVGNWAEADKDSLIFVEGIEGGMVVFSAFELDKQPVLEYRTRMAESGFRKTFADPGRKGKWVWHDKSAFPWDRVIAAGGQQGMRYASAEGHLTAAQEIARALNLQAKVLVDQEARQKAERYGWVPAVATGVALFAGLFEVIKGMRGGKSDSEGRPNQPQPPVG